MAAETGHRVRLTKVAVERIGPGETLWDSDVRGFGVRCQRQAKNYVLKTRLNGRQRWFTIGEHGSPWTPTTARKEALRLLGEVHSGAGVEDLRQGRRGLPTMADLCQRFLDDFALEHKKPSSVRMDRKNIDNHVIPLLGTELVSEMTRADVDAFKRAVRDGRTAKKNAKGPRSGYRGGAVVSGGPGVANRCLALLSKMFNLAELWEIRPNNSNPVRHVTKYEESKNERYLDGAELKRLAATLAEAEKSGSESPFIVGAIRLLIFTGARLGEILTLRWDYVDLDRSIVDLPVSKTGKKRMYLNTLAKDVLTALPRVEGNPHVIVGNRPGAHLVNITKPWYRIRTAADIEDVRIHDLRHSFASIAVSAGLTLPLIGKLLGHKKSATTERYAHLADDPIRAANEKIADLLRKSHKVGGHPASERG
jgi:integrase